MERKNNLNCYKIKGGQKISGEINCMGAKNLISQAMIAAVIANGQSVFSNCPSIGDVEITANMLRSAGVDVILDLQNGIIKVDSTNISSSKVLAPVDELTGEVSINRMPILFIGALIHKFNEVSVPNLGGCKIGERSLDIHFSIMEKLGIEILVTENSIIAYKKSELKSIEFELRYPSVGATQNAIFLLCCAKGKSIIKNVAIEPEIVELVRMFKLMGQQIEINQDEREIIISGKINTNELKGINFEILGDRVEAASWACLACATDGNLVINKVPSFSLLSFLKTFDNIGGGYEIINESSIRFYKKKHNSIKEEYKVYTVKSDIWPGFSTDWMQPISILLALANGRSIIHETVFENRLGFLSVLKRLGLNCTILTTCPEKAADNTENAAEIDCRFFDKNFPHTAIIEGPTKFLSGDDDNPVILDILDLRAGFAFLIAAAVSDGYTFLRGIDKIERGYGNIQMKLLSLGMNLEKISSK
jgi:UDP-N-acetylglucosamine 1-carboxyvinyltransferase